jgi:hypothetical protein
MGQGNGDLLELTRQIEHYGELRYGVDQAMHMLGKQFEQTATQFNRNSMTDVAGCYDLDAVPTMLADEHRVLLQTNNTRNSRTRPVQSPLSFRAMASIASSFGDVTQNFVREIQSQEQIASTKKS